MTRLIAVVAACSLAVAAVLAMQQGPAKETIDGIRNFTSVDPTIACAGATEVAVIPELANRGFKSIINLRQATEQGANIDDSRRAAEAAGMRFIHLPLNGQNPDPAVVDAFLQATADPANAPMFINCGSAGRVAAMMITKRMLQDGWAEERAVEEATMIGPPTAALRDFALKYVAERR